MVCWSVGFCGVFRVQENAWMRLPHIAVNGMTNCDSLGHCRGPFLLLWACAISHQLPVFASA